MNQMHAGQFINIAFFLIFKFDWLFPTLGPDDRLVGPEINHRIERPLPFSPWQETENLPLAFHGPYCLNLF